MFCGDLLNVSPGCYLHPFESRSPQGRKPARHAAAVLGEREIFSGLMKLAKWPEKIYCERHRRPWTARRVVLVSAPAKGLKRVKKPGTEASRNPPQRRRARARNGVAPYSPARFLGYRWDAGSAGNGATKRRIRLRMLQAGPRVRMETRCPKGREETAKLALCEA